MKEQSNSNEGKEEEKVTSYLRTSYGSKDPGYKKGINKQNQNPVYKGIEDRKNPAPRPV